MNGKSIRHLIIYYVVWFVPSTTPIYIILHEYWGWDMIAAYALGCLIPATIALPFTKWYASTLPDGGITKKMDEIEDSMAPSKEEVSKA